MRLDNHSPRKHRYHSLQYKIPSEFGIEDHERCIGPKSIVKSFRMMFLRDVSMESFKASSEIIPSGAVASSGQVDEMPLHVS